MSEVDPGKAQDPDLSVCSDHDGDRKVAKNGDSTDDKCKTVSEAESSNAYDKKREKKQNDNKGNESGKSNVAQDAKDLNSRHGDHNGVSCITTTADKRDNGSENKSPAIKEKLPKKKKTQKENANGNVKEDGDKKKRKKKKKKKGGNCDDESSKPGREGETSSKDRSDNKSNSGKSECSKIQVPDSIQTQEQSDEIVKVIVDKMDGDDCKVEEVVTNTGDNEIETRNGIGDGKINSAEDKKDEEITEKKDTGDDTIKPDVINGDTATDTPASTTTSDEQAENVERSNDGILDKETLSDGAENLQKPLEFEQNKMTLCQKDTSFSANNPDQALTEDGDNDSAKDNFLDTIIESDEAANTIVEERISGKDTSVTESDVKNTVDEETIDHTDQSNFVSGNDMDTTDGNGRMDNSSTDDGTHMDDTEGSISNMTHEQLQQQFQEQQEAMTRLQSQAQAEQAKANMLTASLRAKLRRKDQEMRLSKFEHEQQVSAVLSHLLYLEGQMQKEHNEILEVLNDKDDIIRRQKAAIEDLLAKNNRYLQALKETHGYSNDNGLVKPQNYIVQQNENISIQDHGNKVILRGNKNKNGDKPLASGHKVRFSAMKDRLRRHKSSLELYQHEPLETLREATMKYGSEENLVLDRNGQTSLGDRKERCRSLIDYPVSLFDVEEGQSESQDSLFSEDFRTPTICRNDSTTSLVILSDNATRNSGVKSSIYGFNELSKSRSVPHALPTVAENDVSPRGRPHSLPSVEMLAKDSVSTTATIATSASSSKITTPTNQNTTGSSPPSESNPFKTFKNVFKRKGSKKKRAAAVTSGKEQTDALKQHFQKYDMT